MNKNSLFNRIASGFAGAVSRIGKVVLETILVGANPVYFGMPVKLENGKIVPLENGDSGKDVYGFVARTYPTQGGINAVQSEQISPGSVVDIMRSGYMTIKLATGSAKKGDKVGICLSASSGLQIGDIVAGTVSGCQGIPATFCGEADSNGITEIAFRI